MSTQVESAVESAVFDEIEAFRRMSLIREAEDRITQGLRRSEFAVPFYPVRGMEASAVGVCMALRSSDQLITTYRCLADVVAKGSPLVGVFGEILGLPAGASKGKGGTMHVSDAASGIPITTGIVGSGAPIAVGSGIAAQMAGKGDVVAVSFGDGATSIGAVHEAMNMAALWKLPILFVCHNNRWGEATRQAGYTRTESLAMRARGYGMAAEQHDGLNPATVFHAASAAVARAREGQGPTFLELDAPRIRGHYYGDPGDYMTADEKSEAERGEPLRALRERLIASGTAINVLDQVTTTSRMSVEMAMDEALASGELSLSELTTDVYGNFDTQGM